MKVTPCSPDSENRWGGFEHNATAHAACQTWVLPRTPVPIAKPRLWRQKAPPPLLPPCHLSAEGKRVASLRLLTHTHKPRNTSTKKSSSANAGTRNKATGLTWKVDLKHRTHSGWFTPLHRASINYLSGALLYSQNKSMCGAPGGYQAGCNSSTHTREKEQRDPTWLKHTLEIKDDQNKGSQTSGKYHPAYPAHPHQFAQSLFHGGTERLEDAARFVREWRVGLSEAPGLWRYWWGLSAGQWAEHIQHGAYHFWAKRGVVRARSEWARPRVRLNFWAEFLLLFVGVVPCLSWLCDQHKETLK